MKHFTARVEYYCETHIFYTVKRDLKTKDASCANELVQINYSAKRNRLK